MGASGGGEGRAFCGAPLAGMCARRRSHFLSLRRKKVTKERATPLSASLRCATGNLRCSRPAGSCSNSPSAQTVASPCPLAAALLGASRRVRVKSQKPEHPAASSQQTRHASHSSDPWFCPFPLWGKAGMGADGASTTTKPHQTLHTSLFHPTRQCLRHCQLPQNATATLVGCNPHPPPFQCSALRLQQRQAW